MVVHLGTVQVKEDIPCTGVAQPAFCNPTVPNTGNKKVRPAIRVQLNWCCCSCWQNGLLGPKRSCLPSHHSDMKHKHESQNGKDNSKMKGEKLEQVPQVRGTGGRYMKEPERETRVKPTVTRYSDMQRCGTQL